MTISPFDPKSIDPETTAFLDDLETRLAALPATHEVPIEIVRKARDEGTSIFPFHPPLPEAEDIDIPGAPGGPGRVRVIRPQGRARGVFLHVHGGGWSLGRPWHQDHRQRDLVEQTGCVSVSVEYRLAPENPWPACADDCAAAARWLIEAAPGMFGTDRLIIGGESAGAHLAASTLLSLKSGGRGGAFSAALLCYGVYDMRMTPSAANWGTRKLILSTPTITWFAGNLAIAPENLTDPLVSPLFGDLSDMPPALFQCGTHDPLLDDTAFMAARWQAAGNAAEVIWYPGGVHAFDYFDTGLAARARADRVAFVNGVLGGAG